jgi:tetratricopeptide (TPR) repeat protein
MVEALAATPTATAEQQPVRPGAETLTPPAVRSQLERVLNSKAFARSPRISRFLSFVVEQTLEGQESKLKEYLLGVEVFGRMDSFDPRIDSIVRVEARRLRYKLEKYYEIEGQNDAVYIQFRKGCYVPTFSDKKPGDADLGTGEISAVPYVLAVDNPHAFALYARGRYNLGRWSADGIAEAISCFTHALEEDPDCASAHAGLASAWMFAAMLGIMPSRDVVPKAKTSAQRALSLAPTCSEAHAILGIGTAFHDWEWGAAEPKLRKAIHVNPCDTAARQWYGLYLTMTERPEQAVKECRKAQQAAPHSLNSHLMTGFACHAGGAYDEALLQYRLVQDLDPSFYGAYLAMGMLFADQRMFEQSIQMLNRASAASPRNPMVIAATAYSHGAAGRTEAAQKAAGELANMAERQYVPPIAQAMAQLAAGSVDIAIAKLDEAARERSVWLPAVRFMHAFDNLRTDSRYPEIMDQLQPC